MNPFFKNFNIFLAQNPVFRRKISKILRYFTKISKIYLKFSNFKELPYKSREFSNERNYILFDSVINLNKIVFDPEGTPGMGMIILGNFLENQLWFCEKFEINKSWWMCSIRHGNLRGLLAKFCVVDQKGRHFRKF